MISYEPFWETLRNKNSSTYILINQYNISSSTINRLRHDQPISTTTIDDLCNILKCPVEDILRHDPPVSGSSQESTGGEVQAEKP